MAGETEATTQPVNAGTDPKEVAVDTEQKVGTDIGTPSPEVSSDNLPTQEPEIVEPSKPPVRIIKKVLHRTRYTWNVYHTGNETAPVFTMSLVENDPELVANKFWEVLSANVSLKQVSNYKPRLKSIEVLD